MILGLPFPPLSLLYLLAVRYERLPPSFAALLALTAFPVASAIIGIRGLRAGGPRSAHLALLALAAFELLWAVVAAAMIGWAVACGIL